MTVTEFILLVLAFSTYSQKTAIIAIKKSQLSKLFSKQAPLNNFPAIPIKQP